MTEPKQPEALRDARWYMVNKDGMATRCTDRADAEKEAEDAQSVWPHMGPHRAVQLVEVADVEALRTGYAAARLEIESLRALSVAPAGEYPPLPEPVGKVEVSTTLENSGLRRHKASPAYTSDQRRAYVDRAMRVAQPTGAQQPGAVYAALPDECDSPEICAISKTCAGQFGTKRICASHGQAPAQAAPAAVAGPLNELEELNLLNKLIALGAKAAHEHAQSNSDDGHKGTAAYVQWQELRAEMGELIRNAYAAPTAQPAPQTSPASQGDALDTARLEWLDKNIFYRDMPEWDAKYGHGSGYNMWVLFAPKGVQGSARSIIDAARAAQEGK